MKRLFLIVVLGLILAGCSTSSYRQNMAGTNWGNEMKYTYTTFDGLETSRLSASSGQTIELDYTCEVTKGKLSLQVTDPDDKVVWQVELSENEIAEADIPVATTGTYKLEVRGQQSGGMFDIAWQVN